VEQSILKIQKQIYTNSLPHFLQRAFYIVNQGTDYEHNWHLDAIGEALGEIYNGNIKRLIINIPPRYLKSFCVSVAFPAWVLGKNPQKRIIVASYSEKLTLKHSTDCRLIMKSGWFRNIFPGCVLSKNQNEKYKFSTTNNGYRFATSVGGTLTGEGGDILIIDDPHNPQSVLSDKYRQKTLDWYSNTFSSRLNDKKSGAIIIVMQRLHPNDLTGYLLERNKNNWHHLSLPVVFEENCEINVGNFSRKCKKDEFLFEKREGLDEIDKMKIDMGTYVFNAQYQQRPMSAECGMFRRKWFRYFENDVAFDNIFLSFDTALKIGINNDPTVCTIWGEHENNLYLIDVFREWLEYPDLKKETIKLIEKYEPMAVLIEDKASGQSLIQDLRRDSKCNVIAIKVTRDKITRFASVTPFFESGKVFILKNSPWLFEYEYELVSFPNVKHDDQVDSTSQFLSWINGRKTRTNKSFRLRKL
jgi:predicted phage terminase large subunit-like protein